MGERDGATPPVAIPPDLMGNVERYAVYRCFSDAGELLYVGETGELGKRLAAHAQKAWFLQVRGITLEWHIDELDALNAERRAIHVEHPRYNIQCSATRQLAGSVKPRSQCQPRAAPGRGGTAKVSGGPAMRLRWRWRACYEREHHRFGDRLNWV